MKAKYGKTNYVKKHLMLHTQERIEDSLKNIDIPSVTYTVDSSLGPIIRVFLHTVDQKDFTDKMIQTIKRKLEEVFKFKNEFVPAGTTEYDMSRYIWAKDLRKSDGSIFWKRRLVWENETELWFFIENVSVGVCKLIKKTVEKEVYEMDCG